VAYVEIDRSVSIPVPRTAKKPNCDLDPTHPSCSDGDGDTGQEIPWGIVRVGADLNSNEGADIHVYVIDTGIDVDHPDLSVSLTGFASELCRAKSCGQAWDDDNGHGTHVSGTIGALDNSEGVLGVASLVTLHAVKVLNKRGSGTIAGVIAGVDWVAAETSSSGVATVANMSLGASGSKVGTCTALGFTIAPGSSDSFHEALCNAKNVGVVFAVAAGNSGADAERAVPAAYDDAVIAVSATKQGDDWPNWSNWGDNSAAWTGNNSAPVAIAAPGMSILSTWRNGGTNTISGTSMASPHVAGACALRLASNPQVANGTAFANVRSFLLGAAEGTGSFSNTSGRPHAEDFLNAGSL
jgi:subtilisin